MITGKSSMKNGSLNDVLEALEGKYVRIYDTTPENPPIELIPEFVSKFTIPDIDVVIGLGGGSPMDTAEGSCCTFG